MIIVTDRKLNIPRSDLVVGFTGDNLVETRTFELPKIYNGVDLSEFDFKLDTQLGEVKNIIDLDKSVAEDKITLTWTVRESHVLNAGRMAIQLRAFSQGEEKWHSAQDYVLVLPSINATEVQPDPLPSEFEQMEARVTAAKNEAQEAAQTVEQQADRAQGIADEFENETLPAAIAAVEAKVDEAKAEADRAEEAKVDLAIAAANIAASMVVEEGQNWEEEVFLTIAVADIVRAMSVEEGQYWEGVSA